MYAAIAANKRNTILMIGAFIALLSVLSLGAGYLANSYTLTTLLIGFILVYTFIQYQRSESIAISMSGAVAIAKHEHPQLWNTVENLAITEGLPMPKIYIIEEQAPNAFAAGRDPQHAVIAVTTGLLAIMDDQELEGVLAHEMSHIKNYDIRVSTIVLALMGAIAVIAQFALHASGSTSRLSRRNNQAGGILIVVGLVAMVLSWIVSPLVSAAISRQREYLADATAAEITRYPEGLQRALAKLRDYGQPMHAVPETMAHMYISNPFTGSVSRKLLASHPPLDERIKRLNEIGHSF